MKTTKEILVYHAPLVMSKLTNSEISKVYDAMDNYAITKTQQYTDFIKWMENKPEYRHIYQQYLQQKYP